MFFLRLRREGSRRLKGSVSARRGDYRNMDVTLARLSSWSGRQVQGGQVAFPMTPLAARAAVISLPFFSEWMIPSTPPSKSSPPKAIRTSHAIAPALTSPGHRQIDFDLAIRQ